MQIIRMTYKDIDLYEIAAPRACEEYKAQRQGVKVMHADERQNSWLRCSKAFFSYWAIVL